MFSMDIFNVYPGPISPNVPQRKTHRALRIYSVECLLRGHWTGISDTYVYACICRIYKSFTCVYMYVYVYNRWRVQASCTSLGLPVTLSAWHKRVNRQPVDGTPNDSLLMSFPKCPFGHYAMGTYTTCVIKPTSLMRRDRVCVMADLRYIFRHIPDQSFHRTMLHHFTMSYNETNIHYCFTLW